MKIYTKKGDSGKTMLLGGSIVLKNNIRLECYGSIDELNAFIGNLHDQNIKSSHKKMLLSIQHQLFNLSSVIAFDGKREEMKLPEITKTHIECLEREIDKLDVSLPKLTSFILPSGHDVSSKCHIARTVCRRAERKLVALSEKHQINPLHLKYLNRLSDYLFILARDVLFSKNLEEIKWEKK